MKTTRRNFVRGVVALGAGVGLAGMPGLAAQASSGPEASATDVPSILYDLTQCVGCHLCEIACQKNKGLPEDVNLIRFRKPYPDVAPDEAAWAVRRHQCLHCNDPACAAACPVAAMYKTPEGPVIYRDERCLGCRYCMAACPFGVPTFDWDRGLLDGALIRKCNFCYERQTVGKLPACIEACPAKAVIFGTRSEMLAEAKRRIAEHPDKYVNHIYGENEAGGTSFLLLSGVPFEKLGLPQPGNRPLPPTARAIMGGTIPFALGWASVLTGITYFTQWREKRMHENKGHGAGKGAVK